jgi:formylmethanofuran dehydrogenase subunit A
MSILPEVDVAVIEMAGVDEFRRRKVDVLRKYCQKRGLSIAHIDREDELDALAITASCQNTQIVAGEANTKRCRRPPSMVTNITD